MSMICCVLCLLDVAGCVGTEDETPYTGPEDDDDNSGDVDLSEWDLGPVSAAELLDLTASCNWIGGDYAENAGESASIPVCGLEGAVHWTADFDVDCDGLVTDECNEETDPWFQPMTALTDSNGNYIDASIVPYLVVPSPSSRFNYANHGVRLGAAGAIVYNGRVEYVVFADTGPEEIIGEGSYAAAVNLGIDPDPETGGSGGPVTFIVFSGEEAVIDVPESHAQAQELGERLANRLLGWNQAEYK